MPSTPDRARRDRHDGAGPTTTLDIAALRGRVEPGDILLIRTGYNARRLGRAAAQSVGRRRAGRSRGTVILLRFAFIGTLLAVGAEAEAQGLAGLRRVSLAVDVQHPIDSLTVEDLLARLEDALRQAEPAMSVHDSATDRLRLVVSVRPVSASTLRGFWLPLSGTYGIGGVTLELERMVSVPGTPRPFPAIVWQAERSATGPWRTAGAEIMRLTDELIAQWLDAHRQAR
jgi:hypothetical protein